MSSETRCHSAFVIIIVLIVTEAAMQLTVLVSALLLCCGHVAYGHVIHVNMTDDVGRGVKIADVRQTLSPLYEPSVLEQLTFAFLSNPESLFHLDAATGVLTAARPLDRDQLCPGRRFCVVRVDVAVQPARYFRKLRVEVSFDDVNDNDPRFQTTTVRLDVSEATAPGSALPLPTAHDPDGPPFSVDRYELVSPDTDAFELRVTRNDDGGDASAASFDLRLVVARALDREDASGYRVMVRAMDGGQPERTGSVDVEVVVGDVNDNRPVFEQATYDVEVSEDWTVTSPRPLLTVRAVDADDDSIVTYRFTDRTIDNHGQLFAVDRHTGLITLTHSIDYEQTRSVMLVFRPLYRWHLHGQTLTRFY